METVNIPFTREQLEVLNQALIELPFRLAHPLITHVNEVLTRERAKHDAEIGGPQ